MAVPKIIERTLYPPLTNYLKQIGLEAIGEAGASDSNFSDLIFKVKDELFLVEIKIGKPTSTLGLSAMAQAERYARQYKTRNFMVLIFPEEYRNQPITSSDMLERLALKEKVTCLIFSDYWTESLVDTPSNIFQRLKDLVENNKRNIDFKTVVAQIKTFVLDLNSIVYQIKTDELVSEVVEKLDLFTAIGDIKDKETAKRQVINLSSYLLFNQLLFYHVYQKLSKNIKLSKLELQEITKPKDLQVYFDAITDIDYKAIYRSNILSHIPNKKEVVDVLNEVIGAIKLIRAEYVTHDLAGRFFHDLIPFEVRKVLAAFYTHPNSADLLAGLTIDSWDESIIDPACGSGTLLVSSYQTKLRKSHAKDDESLRKIHKKFLEEDISGIDIMPFASHITTINLAMQHIEQQTNLVRIAAMDSLSLAQQLKSKSFTKGKGIKISGFEKAIQQTFLGTNIVIKKQGSVSMQGKGADFYLVPDDIVIMNPPFSDREKMPKEMRDKINNNKTLTKICGSAVNFWGYFIALSDLLIKNNGKIGAVLPIDLTRSRAASQIREYLLENYSIKYIVKSVAELAFSEGASFKDILFIAEKRRSTNNTLTGIILFKEKKNEVKPEQIQEMVNKIKEIKPKDELEVRNDLFDIYFVKQQDFITKGMSPFVWASSIESIKPANIFFDKLYTHAGKKLMKINTENLMEGFHTSPKGLSQIVFVTDPLDKSRTTRSSLIFDKQDGKKIFFVLEGTSNSFSTDKANTVKALKTVTGLKSIDITKLNDTLLLDKFSGFEKVVAVSDYQIKDRFDWASVRKRIRNKDTYVTIFRRFNPYSPNTHVLSFYSDTPFVPTDALKIYKCNKEEAVFICAFLNSSIALLKLLQNRQQTTGQYIDTKEDDLINFDLLNVEELTNEDKSKLVNVFNKIKNSEFPSLMEQFEKGFQPRKELDSTILEILGLTQKEIEQYLPKLYEIIANELRSMRQN